MKKQTLFLILLASLAVIAIGMTSYAVFSETVVLNHEQTTKVLSIKDMLRNANDGDTVFFNREGAKFTGTYVVDSGEHYIKVNNTKVRIYSKDPLWVLWSGIEDIKTAQ